MTLSIRDDGPCRTLLLDRPQAANALSAELVDALTRAVADAAASGVQVLVLQGAGRNFSAGFDFEGIAQASDAQLLHRFVRIELLLQAVAASPCLTLALAHGPAFGAGADLFAACQWRVADPGARFRMPGLAFGIVLGTRRLGALVGPERARAFLQSMRTMQAPEALEMGLATRLAPQAQWGQVTAQALDMAQRLPPASRAALGRALADDSADRSLADLVRSAAVPGLRDRMLAYRQAQLVERQKGNGA